MSKIGQLNIELEEEASELGYRSLREQSEGAKDMRELLFDKVMRVEEMQGKAHAAWLEEKKNILVMLDEMIKTDSLASIRSSLEQVKHFIEEGEA